MKRALFATTMVILLGAGSARAADLSIVFEGVILFYSDAWTGNKPVVWVLVPLDGHHHARLRVRHEYVEDGLSNTRYRVPDSDNGDFAVYDLKGEELWVCDAQNVNACEVLSQDLIINRVTVTEKYPCESANPSCANMPNDFLKRRDPIDWVAEVSNKSLRRDCLNPKTNLLSLRLKLLGGTLSTLRLEGQVYPDQVIGNGQFKLYNLPDGSMEKALANAVSVTLPLPKSGDVEIRSIPLIGSAAERPILLSGPVDKPITVSIEHLPDGDSMVCNDPAEHFRILYRLLDVPDICDPSLKVPAYKSGGLGGDEACPPGRR